MDLISYAVASDLALSTTVNGKNAKRALAHIQQLESENQELRIRIGVLIRMLIERGVFSAEEFDGAVKQVQAQLSRPTAAKTSTRAARQKKV